MAIRCFVAHEGCHGCRPLSRQRHHVASMAFVRLQSSHRDVCPRWLRTTLPFGECFGWPPPSMCPRNMNIFTRQSLHPISAKFNVTYKLHALCFLLSDADKSYIPVVGQPKLIDGTDGDALSKEERERVSLRACPFGQIRVEPTSKPATRSNETPALSDGKQSLSHDNVCQCHRTTSQRPRNSRKTRRIQHGQAKASS